MFSKEEKELVQDQKKVLYQIRQLVPKFKINDEGKIEKVRNSATYGAKLGISPTGWPYCPEDFDGEPKTDPFIRVTKVPARVREYTCPMPSCGPGVTTEVGYPCWKCGTRPR